MTISAELILDSISPQSIRLITMLHTYPKFIHSEHLRHRTLYIHNPDDFSFSVSSSRAIPVSRNLEEVRSDELRTAPVYWGAEQKGMSGGEELTGRNLQFAKDTWKEAALQAVDKAAAMSHWGVHKSIVNRILEPFLHVRVLVTGTQNGWLNFFGLRLDKNAQPEIRVLAEHAWRVWNESTPTKLNPGEWHLPFIDKETWDECQSQNIMLEEHSAWNGLPTEICVSVARCARLSYLSFDTQRRSTIKEDLNLYNRLVGSYPLHASPAEHIATPDIVLLQSLNSNTPAYDIRRDDYCWTHPELHGNFSGYIQYRKLLKNENVAPLPAEYQP